MRELKFRGWDGETLRDLDPDSLAQYLKAGLTIIQYTDLKDKNYKEIYEGDIIKTNEGKIRYLRWFRGKFLVASKQRYLSKKETGYQGDTIQLSSQYEIIGNVFKDGDLLKS